MAMVDFVAMAASYSLELAGLQEAHSLMRRVLTQHESYVRARKTFDRIKDCQHDIATPCDIDLPLYIVDVLSKPVVFGNPICANPICKTRDKLDQELLKD